jgi:hypothetical protein
MTAGGTISGAGADASGSVDIGWAGPVSAGPLSAGPLSAGPVWDSAVAGASVGSAATFLAARFRVVLAGASPPLDGSAVAFLAVRLAAVFLAGLSAAEPTPNSGACSIVGASGADDGGPAARLAARRRRGLD